MKKAFAIVTCLCVFLVVISGCQKAASFGSASKEPYTFTMLTSITGQTDSISSDATPVGKVLKDKFNVTLVLQPYAGDYNEKVNLMLAAKDYPEVVLIDTPAATRYINANALVPLDGYLKNMPNFKATYSELIPYWRMADSKGRLFIWQSDTKQETGMVSVQWDVMVRTDALEAMGWPHLVTEDDYIAFMKGAMAKIPKSNGKPTIGMTGCFAEAWGANAIGCGMFSNGGYVAINNNGVVFNPKTMKVEDWLSNPYCKGTLRMFNKMQQAGVLDPEIFTDTYAQTDLKANSGQPICVWYTGWMTGTANPNLTKAGHPEMSYIVYPINLKAQVDNKETRYIPIPLTYSSETYAITDKCKSPERVLQVLDYCSSNEGQVLLGWGIKGEDYTVGTDGKRVITDTFKSGYTTDPNYLAKRGIRIFRMFGLSLALDKNSQDYEVFADPGVAELTYSDRQKEAFTKLGWKNNPDAWKKTGVPLVAFSNGPLGDLTLVPDSDEARIEAEVTDLRGKAVPKLVLAKTDASFDAIWTQLMTDYNKIDWHKMVDKYNALYVESAAKLKEYKNK